MKFILQIDCETLGDDVRFSLGACLVSVGENMKLRSAISARALGQVNHAYPIRNPHDGAYLGFWILSAIHDDGSDKDESGSRVG